ncbi:hypothetical protein [Streptomyces sp. NPDC007083]|uniref:hypothetical protein n=1 Tax=unclassified Streptomyces TaxID=2593676 RepID=UPI0033ED3420
MGKKPLCQVGVGLHAVTDGLAIDGLDDLLRAVRKMSVEHRPATAGKRHHDVAEAEFRTVGVKLNTTSSAVFARYLVTVVKAADMLAWLIATPLGPALGPVM